MKLTSSRHWTNLRCRSCMAPETLCFGEQETTLRLDIATLLIRCSVYVFIFSIGLGLQMKIIKAVKEEKAMTWDINLSHSITMIIHFFFTILIDTITYIIPNLKMTFGVWFCYFLLFLRRYSLWTVS